MDLWYFEQKTYVSPPHITMLFLYNLIYYDASKMNVLGYGDACLHLYKLVDINTLLSIIFNQKYVIMFIINQG